MREAIEVTYPDDDPSVNEAWRPWVNRVSEILEDAQGDWPAARDLLKAEFSQYPPHGIAMITGLLNTQEAAVEFRHRFAYIQEKNGKLIKDPRDADVALSAVRINLTNWFLKVPARESISTTVYEFAGNLS